MSGFELKLKRRRRKMGFPKIQLLLFFQVSFISAATNSFDLSMLKSLKDSWENAPPSWVGGDPCGSKWEGIGCINSRVTSITLASNGIKGTLSGDISSLTELQILDLSYNKELKGPIPSSIGNLKKLTNLILVGCSFSGSIPDSIGSLERLIYLSLNSNGFSGRIPPSIGQLSNLYWLDLADNQLSGPIPVSSGSTSGLDLLVGTKHFHFGKNQLSGPIPTKLFSSNMTLIHVLFDSNELTGPLPSTLGLVDSLEVVRFDRNKLTGPVPDNFNNLNSVSELILSNAGLTGPLPNFTGMTSLTYLDMSNNSFDASGFPSWYSTSQSLTTIMMDNTSIVGEIPPDLFSLPHLQTVTLKNNQLNETLDIGPSFSDTLQSIDLQYNKIGAFTQRPGRERVTIILADNPVCQESGITESYCSITQPNTSYATPPRNCVPQLCSLKQISSPTCQCSYPYTGLLVFRAPSFSDLGNVSNFAQLENKLLSTLTSHQLLVDSVSLSNPRKDSSEYLDLNLEIFPAGDVRFNRTTISAVAFVLSNQTFKPPPGFGPFFFIGDSYPYFPESGSSKASSTPIIIGAAAGGSVLLLLLILAGVYAQRQKKRAQRATQQNNPFANWESSKSSIAPPQLKGARSFTFDEVKKYTNNFSDANDIGSGGYGKVYRGTLPSGQLIAIKRAQQESMQGGLEFKTEIELLSRVHHKNLVSLLGFCFERGEQMLIYEYVPNGSLRDSLSGKTGIKLDWIRRLKVALGAARGLAYLHELANPPIIHRDVKSSNVLLDERLNAKVGDFGLSKLMTDTEKGHISTQVKGTMGYLDPEYYMTQQLTEKSDVYSFGVLLLEIATGRKPIERQKYIVREVRMALDRTKEFYNLYELLDSNIADTSLKGLDKLIDLAMKCVQESGVDRPAMSEVVKEIESILQHAGVSNAESASASESYEDASKGKHPYGKDAFDYSGGFSPLQVQPQ